MMKIVIADPLPESAIQLLRAVDGWTVDDRPLSARADLAADLRDVDGLIVRSATKVDQTLLDAAPNLRVVARAGTGVDNVDLDAANARGIFVLNAPGANSVSVAEHAFALMLALARQVTAADASMKQRQWVKKNLMGAELRGKTLGIMGLGRIGQEVARRGRAFDMTLLAHDPFISAHVAEDLDVELVSVDDLCARADYVTLHMPATPQTRHLFDAARFARCKPGIRIVNTARGELIDEEALIQALETGQVAGAGLDVFEVEPPATSRLIGLPQVVATPHIAASTTEAQELVGLETATAVREFLRDGIIRNAVNFPSLAADEIRRLQPYVVLAQRLGTLVAQVADGRTEAIGIRYYGELAETSNELLIGAVLVGMFRTMLSSAVTPVNARAVAAQRGVEIIESRSTRARNFASLISVKLHTSRGERWVEGTVFQDGSPRLILLDGVEVETPLEGHLIVIRNEDRPGVIGQIGTILGRRGVNIASFALGRGPEGAVGVIRVDAGPGLDAPAVGDDGLEEIRRVAGIREAKLVQI